MNHDLCPKMESTLTLLGKKWNALIVYSLMEGPKKFTEVEKYIPGISARMLNERFKELEQENIIKRTIIPDTPVKILYELTEKGIDLSETYNSIGQWSEKWSK